MIKPSMYQCKAKLRAAEQQRDELLAELEAEKARADGIQLTLNCERERARDCQRELYQCKADRDALDALLKRGILKHGEAK